MRQRKGGMQSDCYCFNPRTRKGCDRVLPNSVTIYTQVSTHAPVKDATYENAEVIQEQEVSTHAPVKDATNYDYKIIPTRWFQPTHP